MTGMQRLMANLNRLERDAPKAMARAVRDVALDVQGRAQMKAPVDTGHLRESASTEVERNGGRIVATVGFNATAKGGKVSYALVQHERTDYNHPLGGEAKYLEKALNEVAADFEDRLANGVEAFVRERLT